MYYNFSYKWLNAKKENTLPRFIRMFNNIYNGFVLGKKRDYNIEWQPYGSVVVISDEALKEEVKDHLADIYRRALAEFPELKDRPEFEESLQLKEPK